MVSGGPPACLVLAAPLRPPGRLPGFRVTAYRTDMASPLSGPSGEIVSAAPAGSRLKLMVHPARALIPAAGAWLYGGAVLAAALTMFVGFGSALLSRPVGWLVLLEIFAGLYVLIFALGMALAAQLLRLRQRSAEPRQRDRAPSR